jgi:hypothetical protein
MQIKVEKKLILNELPRFMSKGPLTLKGKDDFQIKSAILFSTPTSITFVGWNKSNMRAKFTLPATVTDPTENEIIDDLELVLKKIKGCKSNEINIDFCEKSIMVSDSRQKFPFKRNAIPIGNFKQAIDWYTVNKFVVDTVELQVNVEPKPKYTQWFTLETSEELSDAAEKCMKDGINTEFTISTQEEPMIIDTDNMEKGAGYTCNIDVVTKEKAVFLIKGGMPIFNQLKGPASVLYYILQSQEGMTRFWFHNGAVDWMLEVKDKAIVETPDDETPTN